MQNLPDAALDLRGSNTDQASAAMYKQMGKESASLQNLVSAQHNKTINVSSKELGQSDVHPYQSNLQLRAGEPAPFKSASNRAENNLSSSNQEKTMEHKYETEMRQGDEMKSYQSVEADKVTKEQIKGYLVENFPSGEILPTDPGALQQ